MPTKKSIFNCLICLLTVAIIIDSILMAIKFRDLATQDDQILKIKNGQYCYEFC